MELQNNYTNEAQSKALIAAGVPEETADCSLEKIEPSGKIIIRVTNYGEDYQFFIDEGVMPCWSLGRLIEMSTFALVKYQEQHQFEQYLLKVPHSSNLVEDMVRWFERNKPTIDYSVLKPDRKPEPKPEPKTVENCAIRYFGSVCPLNRKMEVDQYNCVECEHYFATASKSIICKIANGNK